jgi:ABC-type multidrug transport system fused ATPase/permease subunit
MNSGDKLRALFVVWVAFVLACWFTFGRSASLGVGEVFLGFFYLLAVMGASISITQSVETPTRHDAAAEQVYASTKLKREQINQLDRLVETMNSDERQALLQRLSEPEPVQLTDDGELKQLRR